MDIPFRAEVPISRVGEGRETAVFTGEMRLRRDPATGAERYQSLLKVESQQLAAEEAWGDDFFGALLELRRRLEPLGWRFHCQGASRDVWGDRDYTASNFGRFAQRRHEAQLPRGSDSVDIFQTDGPVWVCTVVEQEAYYVAWRRSLERGANRLRLFRKRKKLSFDQVAELLELSLREAQELDGSNTLPADVERRIESIEQNGHPALHVWDAALKPDRWARRVYPLGPSSYRFGPTVAGIAVPSYLLVLFPPAAGSAPLWPLLLGVGILLSLRRLLAPRCEDCRSTLVPKDDACPRCAAALLPY